ncbi:permease-like cell division protein FtsX [Helcobacillus massiliensis]|uniref:Cell division protein FtsX n=1 Tax=Helcobacillus massiliensis TaxID=521392 RepID=A0A839QVH6_9MICO|nr:MULTISPECIES: permease-like cell division protein FtsX [Helcobacillus]MBB3022011.1 cell division transport system permease protein [Helcobacillus massiliensis]MCG7426905.1 permease-like cell division protein FtsX [Helcobacillus sp. ACRRO]MCT1557433.1 permease-like cell division protein FtsX [Helcobacillus massiliensis]MCT2036386.1 permease-like cell division protein FtsX [Helcobacillus massiliensis]MCT2331872.1 permease-like cell division protein FtsX [Helcobacillus massiliensis]
MRARYVLSESFIGLWRNIAMVISVIIVTAVSLSFVGAGIAMQKQIMEMRQTLVQNSQITIYMCSPHSTTASCSGGAATDAQLKETRDALSGDVLSPYIASVKERSPKEALAIYQEQFSGEAFAQDFTEKDMPVSFHITLKDSQRSQAVVDFFQGRTGVDEVSDLLAVYEPFINALNQSTLLAVGLAVIMLIAAVLLIATTIRMSVVNRRREIAIMRLVGASNLFIRLPFLLEGAVAAIIGGILASGILALGFNFLVDGWLRSTLGDSIVQIGSGDIIWIAPILILLGALMAIGSSVVSLNRYLKV